jgi:hypothetical protein
MAFQSFLLLSPPNRVTEFFYVSSSPQLWNPPMPLSFRIQFWLLMIANVVAILWFEKFVVIGPVADFVKRHRRSKRIALTL